MSLGALCGILFLAGIGLFFFKVSRKLAPWAFLLAGVGLAGRIGSAKGTVADAIMDGSTAVTVALVGASIAVGVALLIGLYLWSKMWKSTGGGLITCAFALMFPTILTAVGLGGIVALLGTVMTGAAGAAGALFAGLGV